MTATLLPPAAETATVTATGPAFADGEGLRALLVRLHRAGPGAWRHDREAAALMAFAADRYAGLARKYGLEPGDAAVAAFEAMRNDATRTAEDPWAVVTVAVRITLIAEHRANGLLTSTDRARRARYSRFHDAERFSDRQVALADYHPALHAAGDHRDDGAGNGGWVVEHTTRLLMWLGWPPATTWTAVAYICGRLADIGDRHSAYETLRRDKAFRARLDVPHERWIGLLRITLGHASATGVLRHGVLARLLAGDTLADLLDDDELVAAAAARPGRAGDGRG